MEQKPKADLVHRIIAAMIDGIIGSILVLMIPIVGAIISTVYMLTKDAVIYELTKDEGFKNRSLGKKLMGIELEMVNQPGHVDWMVSITRNLPLAIGSLIAVVPLVGWILGGIVGAILFIIELFMVLLSVDGRRIGDQLAKTRAVRS